MTRKTPATDSAPLLEDAIDRTLTIEVPDECDPLDDLERKARCIEITVPNISIKITRYSYGY